MDHLPFELHAIILSFLPQSDVQNFRLVSHTFASIGLQSLPIGKHFCFRKHSLERLRRIAHHPVLSRNLKEVIFFVDMMPGYSVLGNYERWRVQARMSGCISYAEIDELATRLKIHKYRHGIDQPHDYFVPIGWHHQLRIHHEQEELLRESEKIFKSLQQSFAMLPNLKAFSLDTYTSQYNELMRPLFVIEPRQAWYCYNLMSSIEGFEKLSARLLQAALAKKNINDLNRNTVSSLTFFKVAKLDYCNAYQATTDGSALVSALEDIRVLHLNPASFDYILDEIFIENSHLQRLGEHPRVDVVSFLPLVLKNTPNLRSLTLSKNINTTRFTLSYGTSDLGFVIRNRLWPQLLHLDLQSVTVGFGDFKAFLSAHSKCLRELELDDITLLLQGGWGNWIELLLFIKENLNLSELKLGSILFEADFDRVLMFVLHLYMPHMLQSNKMILVRDAIRYLVCGKVPDEVKWELSVQRELSNLTLRDFSHVYGSVRVQQNLTN